MSCLIALLKESSRQRFTGRILTLGVQDVFLNLSDLRKIIAKHDNFQIKNFEKSNKKNLADLNFISDKSLFTGLGFDEVLRLDASQYEGAEIVHDLNSIIDIKPSPLKPHTAEALVGNCDLVFDGGTIEHIFNIPNAFRNIFALLKVGGRVIHAGAPISNHIDHGFYMFSPTLFYDYYSANNYHINVFQIIKYRMSDPQNWEILDYVPGSLLSVSMGGLDDACYATYLVVTKTERSTWDAIPQQGMYSKYLWNSDQRDLSIAASQFKNEADSAISDLMLRLFFRPRDASLLLERMKVYLKLGELEKALTDANTILELLPQKYDVLFQRAEIYRALGKLNHALNDFSSLIVLDLKNAVIYSKRAALLHSLGRLNEAMEDRTIALNLLTGIEYDICLGEFAMEDGDASLAIKAFTWALQKNPNDVSVLSRRAMAYHLAKDIGAAVADLKFAIVIEPENIGLSEQLKRLV